MICLLPVLLLFGCGRQQPAEPAETVMATPATEPETVPPETTQPPKITVYPGAVEHYLGGVGNGYDYSWKQEYPPEFVMIHFCSAVVDHRDDPYNMKYVRRTFTEARVSIHYILDREGTVYCYIPENRSAWHAGKGEWGGDEKYTNNMNRYSIGIELVGMGSMEDMAPYLSEREYKALDESLLGFTDAQYEALKLLVADICERYNIPLDRDHVIGHEEYSPKKNDPGDLFDWSRIIPERAVPDK